MKNSVANVQAVVVSERLAHLRDIKREASRRCRARAAAIANGELLSLDLAIRSAQKKALKVENFKMQVAGKTVRLNRNGGEKVALVITENGQTSRKSFKDIRTAIKAFNETVGA